MNLKCWWSGIFPMQILDIRQALAVGYVPMCVAHFVAYFDNTQCIPYVLATCKSLHHHLWARWRGQPVPWPPPLAVTAVTPRDRSPGYEILSGPRPPGGSMRGAPVWIQGAWVPGTFSLNLGCQVIGRKECLVIWTRPPTRGESAVTGMECTCHCQLLIWKLSMLFM